MLKPLSLKTLSDVAELAAKVFKPGYISLRPDFFEWQFEKAAELFGDGSDGGTWISTDDNDRVTGIWLSSIQPMWLEGKPFMGSWGHDWYADPDMMGGALPLIIDQITARGVFGGMGAGIDSVAIKSRIFKYQWVEMRRLFGVIDPAQTLTMVKGARPSAKLYLRMISKYRDSSSVEATEIDTFDATYDDVWAAMRDTISFGTNRTRQYMNWRYRDNPFIDYLRYRFDTPDGPAYFVWRYEKYGDAPRVARIVEAIGLPSAIAAAYPALASILAGDDVAFCDYYGTHGETISGLLYGGMRQIVTLEEFDLPRLFAPLADDFRKTINLSVIVTPENDKPWLYDMNKWLVTKGDGNQDRINP